VRLRVCQCLENIPQFYQSLDKKRLIATALLNLVPFTIHVITVSQINVKNQGLGKVLIQKVRVNLMTAPSLQTVCQGWISLRYHSCTCFFLLVYVVINRLLLNIQNYNTYKINYGTKGRGCVDITFLLCFGDCQVKSWSRDQHLDRLSWVFSVPHAYD